MRGFISNKELEELGESLIASYLKGNDRCLCIDIEGFIKDYLGLEMKFVSFAEEDKGKIGFLSDGKTELSIYTEGRAVKVIYPKWHIVLDNLLQSDLEFGRRRFTMAHEAAHYILEKHNPMMSAQFHRVYDREKDYTVPELAELMNLNETQADKLAATLLMPRFIVERALKKYNREKPIKVYGSYILAPKEKITMRKMSDSLGVSFTALFIRLRDMELLEFRDQEEYFKSHLMTGGVN